MIKITRKVEYALMTLNYLEKNEEPVSVKAICDELSLPFDTVSQVLQVLGRRGVIKSFKGSKGGYKLVTDLSEMNILELSEMVEKKKFYKSCEDQVCTHLDYCQIKDPINKIYEEVSKLFESMKVSDLIGANV